MAYPKMKPCPECNDTTNLDVFTYENGARHVECVKCNYLGPACTSILWAIRHHNNERDQRAEAHRTALAKKLEYRPEEASQSEALNLGIGGRGVVE